MNIYKDQGLSVSGDSWLLSPTRRGPLPLPARPRPQQKTPFSQPEAEDAPKRVTSRSELQNGMETGRGGAVPEGPGSPPVTDAPMDKCPAPLSSRFGAPRSTGGRGVSPRRKTQHSHRPRIDPEQPTPPMQMLWGFTSSHPDVTPKRRPSCGFFCPPSVVHFRSFLGWSFCKQGSTDPERAGGGAGEGSALSRGSLAPS